MGKGKAVPITRYCVDGHANALPILLLRAKEWARMKMGGGGGKIIVAEVCILSIKSREPIDLTHLAQTDCFWYFAKCFWYFSFLLSNRAFFFTKRFFLITYFVF